MDNQWLPQYTHKDVISIEEKVVFSGYSQVKQYRFQFALFAGGQSPFIHREVFYRPAAVAVLLYDPDVKKVVLIEQFRIGALDGTNSPWILEVVAGVIDTGETPEIAAIRETAEESGCRILSLIPVCDYLVSPGVSNEKIFIYCGRVNAPKGGGIHGLIEDGEDIKLHTLSIQAAFDLLSQGKITSSPTIIALQWLQLNYASLQFPQ